jgi:hypothetical protein
MHARIWHSAAQLVRDHAENADVIAAASAREMAARGDRPGEALWNEILSAAWSSSACKGAPAKHSTEFP